MSRRILLVVPLACGIVGLVAHRSGTAQVRDAAVPDIPQLAGFDLEALDLPAAAGAPFDVVVPLNGQPRVLSLQPYSLRAPDFQLLVDHGDGVLVPVEPDPPATYRGTVQGVPGSSVRGSLFNGQLSASIRLGDGDFWYVEPLGPLTGTPQPAALHVIHHETDSLPYPKGCGTEAGPDDAGGPQETGGGGGGTGLRITDFAADADVEYWQKNGSDVQATMVDIELVTSVMENIYESQVDLVFEVTTIVVRTGGIGSDPYTAFNCGTLLEQFQATWTSAPELGIRRDVAELFTGRNLSGCLGIAYLGTVCNSGFGYNVVESKAPGLSLTLRAALSAHETGHSFDALHCCGSCFGCGACRIMCPCIGGCSGIVTSFGAAAVAQINNYSNSIFCLADLAAPLDPPFFDDFPVTALNTSNWIFNDGGVINSAASGEPSAPNSLNLDSVSGLDYADDEIRTNFINLDGLEDATVTVSYHTEHVGVEAGETLIVEYWSGTLWAELDTITSDGVDQTQFDFWEHELTGLDPSPFHTEFRLRFRTDGNISNDEWYIDNVFVGGTPPPSNDNCDNAITVTEGATPFTTIASTTDGFPQSCDGGAEVFFENDIWFRYTPECTGEATFSTCNDADFDTRIAVYFDEPCTPVNALACSDNAAGCGTTSEVVLFVAEIITYLVRVGSPFADEEGMGTLTISCAGPPDPCPWDCADGGDGTVGITDFLALLSQWGEVGTPCDIDGGGVGITDFLELLSNWGDCP